MGTSDPNSVPAALPADRECLLLRRLSAGKRIVIEYSEEAGPRRRPVVRVFEESTPTSLDADKPRE